MSSLFANIATFDPMTIDTQEINRVCNKIPKDGHIDINIAERLATTFLQCADHITDLIALSAAYAGNCEAERRDLKSQAIESKMSGTGGKSATVAVQLFGNDVLYKEAHRKQALAEAFLEWLKTKYKNLMAAHVLCKDIIKIHHMSRERGDYKSANPHGIDSEEKESITESDDRAPVVGKESW